MIARQRLLPHRVLTTFSHLTFSRPSVDAGVCAPGPLFALCSRAQAQDLGCTVLTKVLKALAEEPQAAVEKGGRRTAAASRASVANQPLLASSPAPWPARHQTPAAQPQHHPLLVQGPLLLFPMASDNNNSSSSSSSNGGSDENVPAFDQGGGGGEQTHAREEEMGEEGEAEDGVAQARLHRGGATHGDGSVTTAGAWTSPHSTSRRGTTEAPQARTLSLQEFEALREEASALCESSPTPFSFLALAKVTLLATHLSMLEASLTTTHPRACAREYRQQHGISHNLSSLGTLSPVTVHVRIDAYRFCSTRRTMTGHWNVCPPDYDSFPTAVFSHS